MPLKTPLLAVLPAAAVAVLLLLAAWRPWSRVRAVNGWWGSALALGLAIPIADRMVWQNWPGLWPTEEHRRLPMIALLATAFGLLHPLWRGRPWRGYAVAGLAAICLVPLRTNIFTPPLLLGDLLLFGCYVGATAMLVSESDPIATHTRGPRLPLVYLTAGAGAALVTIQSHAASVGFTAASVAAVMGVFAILAFWRPNLDLLAAATPIFAVLLLGILLANFETRLESKI